MSGSRVLCLCAVCLGVWLRTCLPAVSGSRVLCLCTVWLGVMPSLRSLQCAEEVEAGALVSRPPAPLAAAPPQRQRVLNILDRARLISENSRVAKMAKGVDSRR